MRFGLRFLRFGPWLLRVGLLLLRVGPWPKRVGLRFLRVGLRFLRFGLGAYMYQQPPPLIEFQTWQLLGQPSLSVPGGQGQAASSGFPAQKDSLQ
jgi:hypothetical protein